jgi:acetyltransferase-like isoleucine patch superfamily enzyme
VPRTLRLALLNVLAASALLPSRIRLRLYRLGGVSVGDSTVLSGVFVGGPQVTIGDACFVNRRCVLDAGEEPGAAIVIEDGAFLAFDVRLLTSTHAPGGTGQRAGANEYHPVRVGRGAWLGAGATVLPGVTVAPGCVVAAGAVVTADTEPDGLYAGVPAVRKRTL